MGTGAPELTVVAWQTKSKRVVCFDSTTTVLLAVHRSGGGPDGLPESAPITEYEPGASVTV
jgi:hypothetical protein